LPTLGLVVGGAGLVVLAAGGVFGGLALAAGSDVEDTSQPYADRLDDRERAEGRALAADVLLGTGLAGVAVAAVLLLTSDSADPTVVPARGGLALRWP